VSTEGGAKVTGRPPRGWPLRRYMALFVAALLVVAMCAGVFVRIQAEQDARQSAMADASFAALHAAAQLRAGFDVIDAATTPALTSVTTAHLFANASACHLGFAPIGAFTTGHVDLIRSDGSILCSSVKPSAGLVPVYAGQSWMSAPTKVIVSPVIDPTTGKEVVVVAYPVAGYGVLAWFLELDPVGPTLLSEFGSGVHQLDFLITSADGQSVIGRSTDPSTWVGKSIQGTAFAASANMTTRPDLSGTPRIYSETAAGVAGWHIFVGADEAAAMAAADELANQGMVIILGGVAVMLVLTFVMHRRVAEPVRRLTERVRRTTAGAERELNAVDGAAEVATLSQEFDALMDSVNTELAARLKGELAAQVSERNYRTLFAGHPQPMWLYDTETMRFLEVNDAAIDAYGYTRDEFMNMSVTDVRPAEDVAKFRELIADTPAYDRSGPWRHLCKDGTVLQVLVTSHSLTFDGRPAR
jgi:PAS domain S-box-containing protein